MRCSDLTSIRGYRDNCFNDGYQATCHLNLQTSSQKGKLRGFEDIAIDMLTQRGWVTYICVGKITIIGLDNGLSPGRRQAIIWTNGGILSTGPLGTNFSKKIYSKFIHFHSRKCIWTGRLQNGTILSRPQCVNVNFSMHVTKPVNLRHHRNYLQISNFHPTFFNLESETGVSCACNLIQTLWWQSIEVNTVWMLTLNGISELWWRLGP